MGGEQCYFCLECFSPSTCTHRRRLAFVTCLEMCGNGWKIISMAFVSLNRICCMTTFLRPVLMEGTTWSWYVEPQMYKTGLLIFRAVADPRNSGISAKSREIPQKTRNTAKSAWNISKYMSAKHIYYLSWLLDLFYSPQTSKFILKLRHCNE